MSSPRHKGPITGPSLCHSNDCGEGQTEAFSESETDVFAFAVSYQLMVFILVVGGIKFGGFTKPPIAIIYSKFFALFNSEFP